MVKYFRREELGAEEEISIDTFVRGIQSEFIFGKNYYEQAFMLLGSGESLIGSQHMYWIKWED